jgi:hypothetical protein
MYEFGIIEKSESLRDFLIQDNHGKGFQEEEKSSL